MKTRNLTGALYLCLLLATSCKVDEAEIVVSRVGVFTTLPDQITGTEARLIGNLNKIGDYDVLDHGFVWSASPKPTLDSEGKISLGPTNIKGEYTYKVTGLQEGDTYYVRAYAIDEKGVRYDGDSDDDDENTFEGKIISTLSLSVFSFSPASAKAGDVITLKGNNFSLIPGNNIVEFGNVRATINTVSPGEITVKVPQGITSRSMKIYITVGGKTAVSYDEFNLINGSWIKVPDFDGGKRRFATSFTIGDRAYILAGEDENNNLKTDFWEYNSSSGNWLAKANFPGTGRTEAVAFSIGNKGYVGTGEDTKKKKDFWEYDPSTDKWSQKTDFGGTARTGAIGFALNGKGYIGLGNDGALKKDFWEYNPGSDSWVQRLDFPGTARYGSISFTISNLGYIGTGLDGTGVTKDFWAYNGNNDSWSKKASLEGAARYFALGFPFKGKGYIGTGYSTTQALNDFWEYDPALDGWFRSANFEGNPRYGASAFTFDSRAFIGIGTGTSSTEKDFWEFKTQ